MTALPPPPRPGVYVIGVVLDHLAVRAVPQLLQQDVKHRVLVIDLPGDREIIAHAELVLAQKDRHRCAGLREPDIAPSLRDVARELAVFIDRERLGTVPEEVVKRLAMHLEECRNLFPRRPHLPEHPEGFAPLDDPGSFVTLQIDHYVVEPERARLTSTTPFLRINFHSDPPFNARGSIGLLSGYCPFPSGDCPLGLPAHEAGVHFRTTFSYFFTKTSGLNVSCCRGWRQQEPAAVR